MAGSSLALPVNPLVRGYAKCYALCGGCSMMKLDGWAPSPQGKTRPSNVRGQHAHCRLDPGKVTSMPFMRAPKELLIRPAKRAKLLLPFLRIAFSEPVRVPRPCLRQASRRAAVRHTARPRTECACRPSIITGTIRDCCGEHQPCQGVARWRQPAASLRRENSRKLSPETSQAELKLELINATERKATPIVTQIPSFRSALWSRSQASGARFQGNIGVGIDNQKFNWLLPRGQNTLRELEGVCVRSSRLLPRDSHQRATRW